MCYAEMVDEWSKCNHCQTPTNRDKLNRRGRINEYLTPHAQRGCSKAVSPSEQGPVRAGKIAIPSISFGITPGTELSNVRLGAWQQTETRIKYQCQKWARFGIVPSFGIV